MGINSKGSKHMEQKDENSNTEVDCLTASDKSINVFGAKRPVLACFFTFLIQWIALPISTDAHVVM